MLSVVMSVLQDILAFQVTKFLQLRKEKKAWHSLLFSVGDKIRARLAV